MSSRDTQMLIVVVTVGILALLLVSAGAFFLLFARAPVAVAPAPIATTGGGPAPVREGYAASLVRSEQKPDGTCAITVHLSHVGTRAWDTISAGGEVFTTTAGAGPWSARLESPLPADGVPDSLDLVFSTGPIPQPLHTLHLKLTIELHYSGLMGSGNSQSSQTIPLAPEPGK